MAISSTTTSELLERAQIALDERHDSPGRARDEAEAVLRIDGRNSAASVVALHALALAIRELGDLAAAELHLRDALDLATEFERGDLYGAAGSGLVGVLIARGSIPSALELADSVRRFLDDTAVAELDFKCALAYQEMGRLEESFAIYTQALTHISAGPDRALEARLRGNRGTVLAYLGRFKHAFEELERAEALAAGSNHLLLAGGIAQNRGFALARSGNVVDALRAFDTADGFYRSLDYPGRYEGLLAADRSDALMTAGLDSDALASAERAVRLLAEQGDVIDLAEARLLLARAQLANGHTAAGRRTALEATAEFEQAGRSAWSALSRYVALMAEARTFDDSTTTGDRAASVAEQLESVGWSAEAASARIVGAQAHLRRGAIDEATQLLGFAAQARHRGTPDRRARAWHATAMLRLAQGNRTGAKRALTAGVKVVLEHQLEVAATELRIGASRHAAELAELGLALALEDGRGIDVLRWGERLRANALRRTSAEAPSDPGLTAALAELRRREAQVRSAIERGDDATPLRTELRKQETRVSNAARVVKRTGDAQAIEFRIDRLRRRLRSTVLVEFVRAGDVLAALVVTKRAVRLRSIGNVATTDAALDQMRFGLSRLANERSSPTSLAATRLALLDTLCTLDQTLLQPLDIPQHGSLVIVPTGSLHGVAWQALPSIRDRAVTVTPSARHWHTRKRRRRSPGRMVVIEGPGLRHSREEAGVVHAQYSYATWLTAAESSVEATLRELEGAELAHFVCHGHFRADSPMFSSLELADGALTIFDLERLGRAPRRAILPACNAGTIQRLSGDEVLGTATALIGIGVETVVAPLSVINDRASAPLMGSFHSLLRRGDSPQRALAALRATADEQDAASFGCLMSLTCFE